MNRRTASTRIMKLTMLGTRHLILYHTEERTLFTRRELYTAEARETFGGEVVMPND